MSGHHRRRNRNPTLNLTRSSHSPSALSARCKEHWRLHRTALPLSPGAGRGTKSKGAKIFAGRTGAPCPVGLRSTSVPTQPATLFRLAEFSAALLRRADWSPRSYLSHGHDCPSLESGSRRLRRHRRAHADLQSRPHHHWRARRFRIAPISAPARTITRRRNSHCSGHPL